MTVNEANSINKGDKIVYICDDWNNNPVDVEVIVTNIWKNNENTTHFYVKPVHINNKLKLDSAFAPISCFKFL